MGTQQPEFTLATKPRLNSFRRDTLTIQAARALLPGTQTQAFHTTGQAQLCGLHIAAQTLAPHHQARRIYNQAQAILPARRFRIFGI